MDDFTKGEVKVSEQDHKLDEATQERVPLTSDNVHQWVNDLIEKGVDTELETCDETLIG